VNFLILDLKDFLRSDKIYKQFIVKVNPEGLNSDKSLELVQDIDCVIDVYKTDQSIYSDIKIEYKYLETCARCLEQFENNVLTEVSVTISEDNDIYDEEGLTIKLIEEKVDFRDILEQSIYLSKPIRVLCDQDCKGICPKCGINKNIETCNCDDSDTDPRLDELANLFNKEV
jgi:uncharacterized protein